MSSTLLAPGDPRRADLDRIQTSIRETTEELAAVRRAHLPRAELEHVVAREFEHLRSRQRADLVLARLRHPGVGAGVVFGEATDLRRVVAVLVDVLGVDDLVARTVDRIEAGAGYQAGLAAPERAKRVKQLEQLQQKQMREEEREALRLEDAHEACLVIRRPVAELDLKLILELWSAA